MLWKPGLGLKRCEFDMAFLPIRRAERPAKLHLIFLFYSSPSEPRPEVPETDACLHTWSNALDQFLLIMSQGAHTRVMDRYGDKPCCNPCKLVLSLVERAIWSFRHIWQSSPPLPPPLSPTPPHTSIVRQGGNFGRRSRRLGLDPGRISLFKSHPGESKPNTAVDR